ncbi:LOW QUALITY PROTEIN: hypothetical protein CVT26_008575 [Gymnopilus dilepis]|uniref:Uncharacterized protein n=1 Tax=Gymnopilus dilepis TaxID=231916 RepID=A0A409XXQ3_9AGAR|nr:LOW QUALITY PROTEIN: hypothetical protein CVT26_008575 [Gymnopilus dilepis]
MAAIQHNLPVDPRPVASSPWSAVFVLSNAIKPAACHTPSNESSRIARFSLALWTTSPDGSRFQASRITRVSSYLSE